ncbi:outer membrane protein assembly factor BamE [Thiohalomonas denitrificans]|uniref:Outer membrane protein assembly factor BamE n=1 Tax=Thiohalomonas denitrificans TaxID=415747 RepID=A0A1G5PJE8_9GAMM|nr:outer membrane protein assembly factor BamE [Thiohalomonas denitrificans]SCZ49548.1 SmpA / OmlA family protein [Thiohalomonas denitrificans]
MQKIIIYFALALTLAGCAHKLDIQQGNILTQAELAKLETGMTKRQVLFLLGSPLLTDPFHQQRWDYYYSYQPGGEAVTSHYQVTVWFEDDRLARYSAKGDIPEEVPLAPRLERR